MIILLAFAVALPATAVQIKNTNQEKMNYQQEKMNQEKMNQAREKIAKKCVSRHYPFASNFAVSSLKSKSIEEKKATQPGKLREWITKNIFIFCGLPKFEVKLFQKPGDTKNKAIGKANGAALTESDHMRAFIGVEVAKKLSENPINLGTFYHGKDSAQDAIVLMLLQKMIEEENFGIIRKPHAHGLPFPSSGAGLGANPYNRTGVTRGFPGGSDSNKGTGFGRGSSPGKPSD